MSTSQSTAAAGSTRTSSAIWGRWPIAVGLLGAAFAVIASPDRETVVISLLVALLCYLAAAALGGEMDELGRYPNCQRFGGGWSAHWH